MAFVECARDRQQARASRAHDSPLRLKHRNTSNSEIGRALDEILLLFNFEAMQYGLILEG